jgi:hypothetical protein
MDLTVFNAVRKNGSRYVRLTKLNQCDTRSNCVTSSGVLRIKGVTHRVFAKISPCVSVENDRVVYSNNEYQAKKSPQYVETRMFKITNRLNTKNICRSFVYSFNQICLRKNLHYSRALDRFDTILITEDISDFVPFYVFLKKATNDEITSVFFQLIYTLQCMNTIRLTHTDTHYGNLFVKRRPNLKDYYDTYEYKHQGRYVTARVSCEFQLKIIDLDGAHKHPITGLRRLRMYDKHFVKGVKNEFHEWGATKTVNPRFDLMKIMFHLRGTRPDLRNLMRSLGFVNSSGRVPYYDFDPKHHFPHRDVVGVDDYGMYYNLHGNFLDLTDKHVLRPKDIIRRTAMYLDASQKHEYDSVSQRNLLT